MQTSGSLIRPVASNFGLHIVLSLSAFFVPLWWALTFALIIYKGSQLVYPPVAFAFEIIITFFIWVMQYWAVKLGKRGNMTENTATLGIGLALLILVICGLIYYIFGQTYVMRIDIGFSVTLLIVNVLCLVLGVVAIIDFGSTPASLARDKREQEERQRREQERLELERLQQQGAVASSPASAEQQRAMMMMMMQQQQQQPPPIAAAAPPVPPLGAADATVSNNAAFALAPQQQQQQQGAAAGEGAGGGYGYDGSNVHNMAPPPGVG